MSPPDSRATDYEEVAADYDLRYRHFEYPGIKDALERFLGVSPAKVLEVGCGTGHWLRLMAERGHRVDGLDNSRGMLTEARLKCVSAGLIQGEGGTLPFANNIYDRIVCVHALHHFPEPASFIRESARVLRPGGGVITFDLDPHVPGDRWYVYDYFEPTLEIDRRRYPAAEQICHWMSIAGLSRVETLEADRFKGNIDAERGMKMGLVDRNFTSQLTVLKDAEYEKGLTLIRQSMDSAKDGECMLQTDIRDYATVGWLTGC